MSRYQDAKARTRQIVESTDSLQGRFFDLFIQATIFVTLVAYSLETLPGINDAQRATLIAIERISIVIFTVEYLLRIWVAQRRWAYIFSFYGLVDFLAIAPFYLAMGVDLRSLRAVRLLRLFSILS